jgi:hypothetical protein
VFHPWYGPGWYAGRFAPRREFIFNASIVDTFHNARAANGVVAISAGDFQRGAFRNQIAVNRAQLAQGSLVHGALPVTPGTANLRFADRPVAAAAIPRYEAANPRFFSRMPAAAGAQRTPFAQQEAAVRNTFSGGGAGTGFSNRPATPAGDPGWRRFGAPGNGGVAAEPRPVQPNSYNPWTSFGSPYSGDAPFRWARQSCSNGPCRRTILRRGPTARRRSPTGAPRRPQTAQAVAEVIAPVAGIQGAVAVNQTMQLVNGPRRSSRTTRC